MGNILAFYSCSIFRNPYRIFERLSTRSHWLLSGLIRTDEDEDNHEGSLLALGGHRHRPEDPPHSRIPFHRLRGAPQLAGDHAQLAAKPLVRGGHQRVDAGLPALLRLLRVAAVAGGPACGSPDAGGEQPQLRVQGDCLLPAAVGDCHGSGLCAGRAQLPGRPRTGSRLAAALCRRHAAAAQRGPAVRGPHPFPVQRLPVRHPAAEHRLPHPAALPLERLCLRRPPQLQAHLPVHGSRLRGVSAALLLPGAGQRGRHGGGSGEAAGRGTHAVCVGPGTLPAAAAAGPVPAIPLQARPDARLLGAQFLGPVQHRRQGGRQCAPSANGCRLDHIGLGAGGEAFRAAGHHAASDVRPHRPLHAAHSGEALQESQETKSLGLPPRRGPVWLLLLRLRLACPRKGHPHGAHSALPADPGEPRRCEIRLRAGHRWLLLPVPAALRPGSLHSPLLPLHVVRGHDVRPAVPHLSRLPWLPRAGVALHAGLPGHSHVRARVRLPARPGHAPALPAAPADLRLCGPRGPVLLWRLLLVCPGSGLGQGGRASNPANGDGVC